MHFPPIMVLGATGRIGALLRRSWTGAGPDGSRPCGRLVWQTRHNPPDQSLNWLRLDPLGDPAGLTRAVQGCAAVLCLAGVTPGPGRAGAMGDNAALAEAAVRAAAQTRARVLLASSAAVYGAQTGTLAESCPLVPQSDYGRAKAEMESRAADLGARLGVAVTALRIANVAGIDAALGGWHPGFRLDRFADGRTPRRSYVGARSLARVLGELLHAPDLPGVLNLAAPGAVEMGALLDAADLPWRPRPAGPGAIPEVVLDTGALARIVALPAASPAALVAEWREGVR